jgi:geranylgeranyl reductase family protein
MRSCDVLIVGGGPAGSSCAWKLRRAGIDVAILDRERFPRDKVCGGWITPQVFEVLEIQRREYATHGVLQPITAFRVGVIGGRSVEVDYRGPVSYGIRRREFDHYLLRRSGACVLEGTALDSLERSGDRWIANGCLRARIVVGAGGHFCPVARKMGAKPGDAVVAQESEFEMPENRAAECAIRGDTPELFFSPDLLGYGWCFRKGDVLNVGLGRADPRGLAGHVRDFVDWKLPPEFRGASDERLGSPMRGHAYLLYGSSPRRMWGDGWILIGDAAGLAYPFSGEGILPAVESGLIAAGMIADGEPFDRYPIRLRERFGTASSWLTRIGSRLPRRLIAKYIVPTGWFARHVVLDRWFLHGCG